MGRQRGPVGFHQVCRAMIGLLRSGFPGCTSPGSLEICATQLPSMVQRQGFSAPLTESDVVAQFVEQNFIDILRHLFPAVVKPVLINGEVKCLGKEKITVQLFVIQF